MATVQVRMVILTVQISLSVCPFNRMAHTANNPIPSNFLSKLAKEYFKKTKRRAKPVLLLSQLIAIYGQEVKPVRDASNRQASTW
jgi:hypothetical protein